MNIEDYSYQIQTKYVKRVEITDGSGWVFTEMCKIRGYLQIKV